MANFTVEIPRNVVPDSVQLELAAVGDILGPSIPNLQNLIKMPSGCGEQNMLNFVPNIVVIEYLKVKDRRQNYNRIYSYYFKDQNSH